MQYIEPYKDVIKYFQTWMQPLKTETNPSYLSLSPGTLWSKLKYGQVYKGLQFYLLCLNCAFLSIKAITVRKKSFTKITTVVISASMNSFSNEIIFGGI